MTEKRCPACLQMLPADRFYHLRGKPNGKCKPCVSAYTKLRLSDPEARAKKNAVDRAYHAAHSERAKAYRAGRKERLKELRRASYLRNRDHERQTNRDWHANNRARANEIHRLGKRAYVARKKANGGDGFTVDQWLAVVDDFNGCCAYCLKPLKRLEMDHFRPINLGGRHDLDNVVPSCKSCNRSKSDSLVFDWLPRFEQMGILGIACVEGKFYTGRQAT